MLYSCWAKNIFVAIKSFASIHEKRCPPSVTLLCDSAIIDAWISELAMRVERGMRFNPKLPRYHG